LWHVDLFSSSRGLPAVTGKDGEAQRTVLFTTRFDGTLWVVNPDGEVRQTFGRSQWLEGGVVSSGANRDPLVVAQDSVGRIVAINFERAHVETAEVPGEPYIGTVPCIAEVDGEPGDEIVVARGDGTLSVLSQNLRLLWRYAGGTRFESSSAIAPQLHGESAIFAQDSEGIVHAVSGRGRPLWTHALPEHAARFPSISDVHVVRLPAMGAVVLCSDASGWLYALDASTGAEIWRAHAGTRALGAPALLRSDDTLEIVTVSEVGEVCVVTSSGEIRSQTRLPAAGYVPRPLLADVDADGANEIIIATRDWRILVASIDGEVEQELKLQGSAREGILLADINADGFLELIAATDCARAYCFSTQARSGWTHPRGDYPHHGTTGTLQRIAAPDRWGGPARMPRLAAFNIPPFHRDVPVAEALLTFPTANARRWVSVVLREDAKVVGSAAQRLTVNTITIPIVRSEARTLQLDYVVRDARGRPVSRGSGISISPTSGIPIPLPPREEFAQAVTETAVRYRMPESWALPVIAGRDRWNVMSHYPERWRQYGIDGEAFVRDAAQRVYAPATREETTFQTNHAAWDAIARSKAPFFVQNEYFRPSVAYPQSAYAEILAMGGTRFLGFQVHEWAYRVWKEELESAESPPETETEATRVFRRDFETIRGRSHGNIYAGEGYCFVAHQAFSWGATSIYAEIGENMPCVPLQFAWTRGAARQWGGKPWGAYISNWFRGAVLDTRHKPDGGALRWSLPEDATGPNSGHSASLEFRMALSANLAGATFVHHESDAHNGSVFVSEKVPGAYSLSEHGDAFKRVYDTMEKYPDRGVPYTPIALLVDFDHGWRWDHDVFGIWPQDRSREAMEALFEHLYPWGGQLDFEKGYLPNGPYGDIMDVLTLGKRTESINEYAVAWPIGVREISREDRDSLMAFVEKGGLLVVDAALAESLPPSFLGVHFDARTAYATGVQTALGQAAPLASPFRYRGLRLSKQSRPLAWTESGAPILAWSRYGNGVVVVGGTEHWVCEDGALVPFVPPLLRLLGDTLTPVSWVGDVQVQLNRTKQGWLVGLLNNAGVEKAPTKAAVINPDEARTCLITYRGNTPRGFVARMGEAKWDLAARGVVVTIPPGEAALVELLTD